jgi:hypothetical protein
MGLISQQRTHYFSQDKKGLSPEENKECIQTEEEIEMVWSRGAVRPKFIAVVRFNVSEERLTR